MASFAHMISQASAIADLSMTQNTERGEKLSPAMLMLMTLVLVDGYLLFPSAGERAAIEAARAKRETSC